jgi:RHS repeat-associated protein
VRWFARYSPTGEAQRLAGDMTLDLRLPGQVFDAETGWHDNLLRTYLPASGHYLEPDPLGPAPGSQARGYANQQPRRYVDPLGLLLFAFDGTRNTPQSQTNIWKMSQRYLDGQVFYHAGPGNAAASYPDWDSITAYSASRILDAQWSNLLAALDGEPFDPAQTIPIDIIGFSRGAALARHFGNLVDNHVADGLFSYQDERLGLVTACVDLRFMGLFDTVAQFGLGGIRNADYDLSIASSWGWVAHAVALQEHRRYFPLSSVQGGEGLNTIEAPFIGAHADIGGGAAHTEDATSGGLQGDLSDVALNWMLWQARSMALRFDAGPAEQSEITHPVVHDQRTTGTRPQGGDRRVDAADGTLLHGSQAEHPRLGQSQRLATEPLIDRYEGWQVSTSNEVGIVDMSGYALWLQNELGWRDLPA